MSALGDVRIKICGMRDPLNIMQVAKLQPDYMGFIFYDRSKRFVGKNFAIPPGLGNEIKRVGVFVNQTMDEIKRLVRQHALDFVQLHGEEKVTTCRELQETGVGVIKVFSVDDGFGFSQVHPYRKAVDFFLFDTKTDGFGGSGRSFDWGMLTRYDQEVPFFLSGGINKSNVKDAFQLNNMNVHALDLNSGVETSPGLKNLAQIKQIKEMLTS